MKNARRNLTFTQPAIVFLEEESKRLGITVSTLLGRIIDFYRENNVRLIDLHPLNQKKASK